MRTRPRPRHLAVAAAATVASLPLWAGPVGAGQDPDEVLRSTRSVTVNGVNCQIQLYAQRYTVDVYATTQVVTTADPCRADQVVARVIYETESGDTVSAFSGGSGQSAFAGGGPAVDLVGSRHTVNFLNGQSVTYTMSSK